MLKTKQTKFPGIRNFTIWCLALREQSFEGAFSHANVGFKQFRRLKKPNLASENLLEIYWNE